MLRGSKGKWVCVVACWAHLRLALCALVCVCGPVQCVACSDDEGKTDLSRKSFDVCFNFVYFTTVLCLSVSPFPLTQVQQIGLVDLIQWKTLAQTSQTHTHTHTKC